MKLKYAAKPFAKLSSMEQDAHCVALLLKINVITGWPVPENDEHQNILTEQLKLFLNENYALLNVEEIVYAIRKFGVSISNWGKNMNLTLLNQALREYENERIELSKLEESKRVSNEAAKHLPMAQADWKPLLELYYQDYLAGRLNFTIMPFEVYGAAMELNYMSGDAWEDWEGTARELTLQQLQADKFECMHEAERYEIQTQIEWILSGEETAQVEKLAKKLSVELLYKTAKQKGIKNLFVQSNKTM